MFVENTINLAARREKKKPNRIPEIDSAAATISSTGLDSQKSLGDYYSTLIGRKEVERTSHAKSPRLVTSRETCFFLVAV